jgi:cellulose synthase/poly-beta-1,6-N-acetylglucosamine synthase-like glycosyltransferase
MGPYPASKKMVAGLENDPWVSIIIPCYNGEAFLQEAIESALAQSYRRVEVIVVDDGSTDRSGEIARSFPVRYFYHANRGLCASRNEGVRYSKGSYILFLDADDRLKPDAIENGLSVLVEQPECAISVGDHMFICQDRLHVAASRKECLSEFHYEALLKSNFIEMISCVLFRRSVLEEIGGFNPGLKVAEDYDLYLRIARKYPICCHTAVMAEYRIHGHNVSRNSQLMLTTTLQVLRSQAPYARQNARRLLAFVSGLQNWRKQYGRQLANEMARSLSLARVPELGRKLLLLLKHYPNGLAMLLVLRMVPGLLKERPTLCTRSAAQPAPHRKPAWMPAARQSSTQAS